ncbi:hypothetical protein AB6A40_011076 [Gnathostoma spinigerum]|uniref:Uncharacterized protein n=1 Tax=Gnathostoma spinigerum TaxID=75299 RepID=A0ABD6F3W4_9BILA
MATSEGFAFSVKVFFGIQMLLLVMDFRTSTSPYYEPWISSPNISPLQKYGSSNLLIDSCPLLDEEICTADEQPSGNVSADEVLVLSSLTPTGTDKSSRITTTST